MATASITFTPGNSGNWYGYEDDNEYFLGDSIGSISVGNATALISGNDLIDVVSGPGVGDFELGICFAAAVTAPAQNLFTSVTLHTDAGDITLQSADAQYEADGNVGLWLWDGFEGLLFSIEGGGPYQVTFTFVGDGGEEEPTAELVYGAVIDIVEKDVLDSFYEGWSLGSSKAPGPNLDYYKTYAMDGNDPLAFWLMPRGYAGADVIITYVKVPPAPASLADTLTLSDMHVPDLVDYLCYRALAKDSRAGAKEIADKFRQSFLLRLGANRQILRSIGQNTTRPPDAEA